MRPDFDYSPGQWGVDFVHYYVHIYILLNVYIYIYYIVYEYTDKNQFGGYYLFVVEKITTP